MNAYKTIYIKLNALNISLLSQLANSNSTIANGSWANFNELLSQLSKLTGDVYYESLRVSPKSGATGRQFVLTTDFSSMVYQATSYLFETNRYDTLDDQGPPDKPKSDSAVGVSQTSILSQGQESKQSQITEVRLEFNQTLTYMTETIVEAKAIYAEGSKERTFLDKLKDNISAAKNTADLIKMIMAFAVELGITTEVLAEIFKLSP